MRALLILIASIMAAAVIGLTACESLYDDFIPAGGSNDIYLFHSADSYVGGDIGGRVGADTICETTYAARFGHIGANNVRAFINVSPVDTTREMTENYGVPVDAAVYALTEAGTIGPPLAAYWDDLLDGTIPVTLFLAGVFPGGVYNYWTGDNGYGTTALDNTSNCNGWTSNSPGVFGRYGGADYTNSLWVNMGNTLCSSGGRPILCIAW